jgi:hypothetical protein
MYRGPSGCTALAIRPESAPHRPFLLHSFQTAVGNPTWSCISANEAYSIVAWFIRTHLSEKGEVCFVGPQASKPVTIT